MLLVTKETGSVICNTMVFLLVDEFTPAILTMFNHFFISGLRVLSQPMQCPWWDGDWAWFCWLVGFLYVLPDPRISYMLCAHPPSQQRKSLLKSLFTLFPPFSIASLSFLSHFFLLHWHIAPTQSYQSFLLSGVQGGFRYWGREQERQKLSEWAGLQIEHLQVNQTLGVRRLNSCSPSSCTSFCSLGFSATILFYSLSCLLTFHLTGSLARLCPQPSSLNLWDSRFLLILCVNLIAPRDAQVAG